MTGWGPAQGVSQTSLSGPYPWHHAWQNIIFYEQHYLNHFFHVLSNMWMVIKSDKVAFTLLWFIRRLSAALRYGFSASSRLVADLRTALWASLSLSLLLRRERVVSLKKRNQLRGFNIFASSRFTCSKNVLSLSKLTRPAASSSFWLFCHHFMPAGCRELLEQLRE